MKSLQDVTAGMLRLGLLVNPYAGVGGPLALKGSDTLPDDIKSSLDIIVLKGESNAQLRMINCLRDIRLLPGSERVRWLVAPGPMGEHLLQLAGWDAVEVIPGDRPTLPTSAADTERMAGRLRDAGTDLLLFAGGDGTARDLCRALGNHLPVLGVPAGVKMHSGVFAINPAAATALMADILAGRWVSLDEAEVRDIDEAEVQAGRVRARHYGEMRVPGTARYLQQIKCSGQEVEALAVEEIAAGMVDTLSPGVTYAFGPGTTVAAVMNALALPNTLLGFDLVRDGALVLPDATASDLLDAASRGVLRVVITPTGGQGSLIGRGNQQLSPALLRRIGRDHVHVLATHAKLDALSGRPLRLDTGDAGLDAAWSGLWPVSTGYRQHVLYAVQG